MSSESKIGSFPPVHGAADAPLQGATDAPGPPPVAPAPFALSEPFDAPPSEPEPPVVFDWRKNVALFLATVASVFFVGRMYTAQPGMSFSQELLSAWRFAVPLLFILLCHEFGHYIAARIHRVPASLPYFLPLPILNPFGTLGAIILMPGRIRSRRALLDIGAAGPLAGMVVAIPLMLYGLTLSHLIVKSTENYVQEGQSLVYWALKSLVFGPIDATHDIETHPVALAAWVGFFVTFLNLLPVGQLDGGHVAYALFGERQNRAARWFALLPLGMAAFNLVKFGAPVLARGLSEGFGQLGFQPFLPVMSVLNWIVLYGMLRLMRRGAGAVHPPVDDPVLGPGRKLVAWGTLLLFVLLFMPSPWVAY